MLNIYRKTLIVFLLASPLLLNFITKRALAEQNGSVVYLYRESLGSNVSNWSWSSSIKLDNTNPVYSGYKSVKFLPVKYGGFYLHTSNPVDVDSYSKLSLSIYPTDDRQKFKVVFYGTDNKSIKSYELPKTSKDTWKTYDLDLKHIGLSGKKLAGIAIQEDSGLENVKSYIDEVKFIYTSASTSNSGSSPAQSSGSSPTTTPTPAPTPSPAPVSSNGYTSSNGKLYKNGSEIKLKGVNWFGFEESTHAVHGLWTRSYTDMISQMKGLGFNAIRIPLCPDTIHGAATTSINYTLNPDLQGLNGLQVLDKVVSALDSSNMYILLDHHRPDCQAISELWYTSNYSESAWINDLTFLANRYKDKSHFIGIDLKNEPHGKASWGAGSTSTDWNTASEKAGKAILAANPNILIFVEGIQENSTCSDSYGHWQGGNLNPLNCKSISKDAIAPNKLVLSPHVYGPDVYAQSYFNDSTFPSNMTKIWDTHFGSLVSKGYTIVPGEWGGKYGDGGNSKDKTWQDAMASYFKSKKICSSFYWSWNPNSGDTGGILQDDWKTVWSNKMSMLNDYYRTCSTD